MPWWIGTIIACFSLAIMNGLQRGFDLSLKNFFILAPFLLLVQVGFWYGFRHSPYFINVWFFGSGCTAVLGVTLGLLFFDKVLSVDVFLGVSFVLLGAWLLVK